MSMWRVTIGVMAFTLAGLTGAMAQQNKPIDEQLDGGAPVKSDKYPGRSNQKPAQNDDDNQPQEHRRGGNRYRDGYRDGNNRGGSYGWNNSYRSGYGSGYNNDVRTSSLYCRAKGDRGGRRFCPAPSGTDRIYFDYQRSDAPCRRGRDYGIERGGVWVDNGCRAQFTIVYYPRQTYGQYDPYGGGYGRYGDRYDRYDDRNYGRGYAEPRYISCESKEGRRKTCSLPSGYLSVELSKRRSDRPCRRGESWGVSNNRIWVSNGCRANFVVTFRNRY